MSTWPFPCVYQEKKNKWLNFSENQKVDEMLYFWCMEDILNIEHN